MRKILLTIILSLLSYTNRVGGTVQIGIEPHPRLLISDDVKIKIDSLLLDNRTIKNLHDYIILISDELLTKPVLEKRLTGARMLSISREALKRILFLSYSYRMTLEKKYSNRAIKEISNVCGFDDWNPSHFLDVAEMTMAVSIGYDWLYDKIDEKSKRGIIDAIINKSFIPSLDDKKSRFFNETNNWNQVCNSSLLFGSIAFFDDAPELSNHIINRCLSSNPRAITKYSPDGGYPEGYNYWNYGTMYQVLLIDALERTFGNDFGLSKTPGFMDTGSFAQFMGTPLGNSFNFGDSPLRFKGCIPLFWFAFKNNDSSLVYNEMKLLEQKDYNFEDNKFLPLIPILLSRFRYDEEKTPTKHIWMNKGETPVFVYRNGWTDKNDTYLGVKGGAPLTSHAHMDAGSFVYETEGVRWATDLGMQDYYSLESRGIKLWDRGQEGQRWDILRFRNDYHNTLTIDSGRHNVKVKAEIIQVFTDNDKKGAVVDLTSTLGKVTKAHREVSLDNENLYIIDSISTNEKAVQLSWVMVTTTKAAPGSENSVLLSESGKQMMLSFESELPLSVYIWQNSPLHEYDTPNPNTIRVGFTTNIPPKSDVVFKSVLTKN